MTENEYRSALNEAHAWTQTALGLPPQVRGIRLTDEALEVVLAALDGVRETINAGASPWSAKA